jgi:UPF0755 protein
VSFILALFLLLSLYSYLFGPMKHYARAEEFIVPPGTSVGEVAHLLKDGGYVKSALVTQLVLGSAAGDKGIRPGGYDLSQSMDLRTISKTLSAMPRLVFVTIPPSVRKEQIGDILARELFWGKEQKEKWDKATEKDQDMLEGVYYPDTYLIPSDQDPEAIAARLRGRFADVFTAYADEAKEKGLDWNEVLTLASLVDREAAKNDKELVAGILWNRLERGMKLQVDATLQYIKGEEGNWWPVVRGEDKYLDSPFNTYTHEGLPPHPINNPTEASVAAVLNAEVTGCLYYLHDAHHQIHCSVTYTGQKANVERYLR